eukprot:10362555-Alexandrium_andersonii.AAC.1
MSCWRRRRPLPGCNATVRKSPTCVCATLKWTATAASGLLSDRAATRAASGSDSDSAQSPSP